MMKKFLLLFLTLAFAMAASGQRVSMSPQVSGQQVKGKYEFRSTHKTPERNGKLATLQQHKAQTRVDIIFDQPEGELKIYERAGGAMYNYWGYLFTTYQDGGAMKIVFAEDGHTAYLQDPISQATNGAWVRAELSDNGKTLTMPLNQHIVYYDEVEYGMITAWVDVTVGDDGYIVATPNHDITEATFTIGDDGTISLNGSSGDVDAFECSGLGLIYDDDLTWAGYADWESVYTPFAGTPVTLPDGAVLEDFSMKYVGADGNETGKMVKVAQVDNDIYVQGFSSYVPDGVMKGTISVDKVIFPSNQYLGVGNGRFMSTLIIDDDYMMLENLEFDYDAATRTMTATDNLTVDAGETMYEFYGQPVIAPYIDHAAMPANPSVVEFVDNGEIGGYNYGTFNVPIVDTEGNFINPNDLYYRIYFDDDELFTFGPDEFPYITEFMTDVPYNYTENYDIILSEGNHYIYFYETGFQRVGIQSIFRGGGEEHETEIVYLDLKEPVVPVGEADHYAAYCDDNAQATGFSAGRAQGYDLAMFVNDPSLKGMKVKGLRISSPMGSTVPQYTGWLSNSLELELNNGVKVAKADIASNASSLIEGHAEVWFYEPYEIGDDGFFAGYTIPVTDEEDPMMITSDNMGGGLWLHTTAALRDWTDMSSMGSPCIELILEGQQENAAVIIVPANTYAKKGEAITVNATLYNHGTARLTSGEYTYEINGVTGTATLTSNLSGDRWGRNRNISITLAAIDEGGVYPLTVTLNKVNGVDNQDVVSACTGNVNIMDFVPKHRVLVEEYTGTWCGWCTRGLVAMQKLAEIFGDDFIGVAYHNGDPMEIMASEYFPNDVQGFPSAFVERYYDVDPYYGYDSNGFGMKDLVEYVLEQLAVVDLNVRAEWTDDSKTEIKAIVESNFVMNAPGSDYGIELMLVEDDMYGDPGTDWDQHNYYSSMADEYGDDPDLGVLTTWPSTIEGFHFNDVLVATTGVIDESLPESIVANTVNNFEYTFNTDYVYNTGYEPLIQNKDKLHIVAVVVEKATGKVLNAAKAKHIGYAGVNELSDSDKMVASTIYFDLTGRMVTNPGTGIYIKVVRYTDGTQRSFKIIKK